MEDRKNRWGDGEPAAPVTHFHYMKVGGTRWKMSDEIESARIQVLGADPRHAELEAKELREVLNRLDGAEVRFAPTEAPRATGGAKVRFPSTGTSRLTATPTTSTSAEARVLSRSGWTTGVLRHGGRTPLEGRPQPHTRPCCRTACGCLPGMCGPTERSE